MAMCQRCYTETTITTMSRFNTQILCMKCLKKEQDHKDYKKAADAELAACKRGNLNYPGIGKPADL